MIISFGQTTPAVKALRKHRTRRDWKPTHAAHFLDGMVLDAYDKSPRNGGKRFGAVPLTRTPFLQSTALLTDEDWDLEGFDYLTQHGLLVFGKPPIVIWKEWLSNPRDMTVVDFGDLRP